MSWYNDSKATTPHAARAAIRSFSGLTLIAGGYDKGVDLSSMADDLEGIDVVIAVGDTASAVAEVFAAVPRVDRRPRPRRGGRHRVDDDSEPGSTVLLSPGCASFDQYTGFEARGDHFRSLVLGRFGAADTQANERSAHVTNHGGPR